MPRDYLANLRSRSIRMLGEHLLAKHSAVVVDQDHRMILRERGLSFCAAWKLFKVVEGREMEILVLAGDAFPFEPPEIAVNPEGMFLRYPHVERSGKLCLLSSHDTADSSNVEGVVDLLLNDAINLLTVSIQGLNKQDFNDEFESYWVNNLSESAPVVLSILRVEEEPLRANVFRDKDRLVLAANEEHYQKWLRRSPEAHAVEVHRIKVKAGNGARNSKKKRRKRHRRIERPVLSWAALVIPLRGLLEPSSYPKSMQELLSHPEVDAQKVDEYLLTVAARRAPAWFLLIIHGQKGLGLGMLSCHPSAHELQLNGFRPGNAPPSMLLSEVYSKGMLRRHAVIRADEHWINYRTGRYPAHEVASAKVAIIGCGALGGDVALLLAKSGVRKLFLFDPDILLPENLGRHILGKPYLNCNKAAAMKAFIEASIPMVDVEAIPKDWRSSDRLRDLGGFDCIVSLTANWPSDKALSLLLRESSKSCPLVFGWMETYGCVGHSLAITDVGGCLLCGSDAHGHFKDHITEPTGGALVELPRCGDSFAPHGYLDAQSTKQMIAAQVIDVLQGRVQKSEHRFWVADKGSFESSPIAVVRSDLVERYGSIHKLAWSVSLECRACG